MRPSRLYKIPVVAFRRLGEERGPEAAAGMAFYAVFSLFPLLLLAVSVGSVFVESAEAQERIINVLLRFVPVSGELIGRNLTSVIRVRGAVGGIGALALIWSASGAFSTLVRNLGRAWKDVSQRNLFIERAIALAIVGSLVGLVVAFLLGRSLVAFASEWPALAGFLGVARRLTGLLSGIAVPLFILVALSLMYKLLPRAHVLWRESWAGAAVSTLGLWLATSAFTALITRGLARYSVVYGSLGALLAFLTWIYIVSVVVLYGAHFAAAMAHASRRVEPAGLSLGGDTPSRDSGKRASDEQTIEEQTSDEEASDGQMVEE